MGSWYSRVLRIGGHVAVLYLFSLGAIAPTVGMAQDMEIGAPCPPRQLRFFTDPEDSLRAERMMDRVVVLAARARQNDDPHSLTEALHAADSLREYIGTLFGDTPHPVGVRALHAVLALQPPGEPEKPIPHERALREYLTRLYPCDTRLGNEIGATLTLHLVGMREFTEAREIGEDNLQRLRGMQDIDSTTILLQERVLGLACQGLIAHDAALVHFQAAIAIAEACGDSVELASILEQMGSSSMALGRFDEAEETLQRRLRLTRTMCHPASESVVSAMNGLVDFYQLTSQRGKAERLAREAIAQVNAPARPASSTGRTFRPDEGVTPSTEHALWINCAMILMENRRDEEAMQCIERSRAAAGRIPSETNRHLTICLSFVTLGKWEQNLARFDRAREYYQRAMVQIDSVSDPDIVRAYRAPIQVFEATLLIDSEASNAEADSLLTLAMPVLEEYYGSDAMQLLMPLASWARACVRTGDTRRAMALIARAAGIARANLPENHFLRGRIQVIEAECALAAGENERAVTVGRDAVRILEPLYDARHHILLDALHMQARCLATQPDTRETAAAMRSLMDATVARVRDAFAFEGEEQQVRVHHTLGMRHLGTIARWARRDDSGPDAPEILMNAMLALKGAVLSENIRLGRILRLRGNEQHILDTLQVLRAQSAAMATRDTHAQSIDATTRHRERIRAVIDSLDGQLRRVHADYRNRREAEDVDWRRLQRSLASDEAIVDYLVVDDPRGSTERVDASARRVLAVVLRASGRPVVVDLCEESAVEKAARAGTSAHMVPLLPHTDRMRDLHRLVFAPLVAHLAGAMTVTIIPDGILHRMPFASLVAEETEGHIRYLDEHYVLQQHASGRDVLASRQRLTTVDTHGEDRFILIGNPAFAGSVTGAASFSMRGWKDLPGTAKELDVLHAVCAEAGISTIRLDRTEASEQAIKALSGHAPRVLHLATHGYFYPVVSPFSPRRRNRDIAEQSAVPDHGDEASPASRPITRRGARGRASIASSGHPLLRSGLILAGANAVWKGTPIDNSADDGVLTAMEVSQLDLTGTELVVLSACETALGDIHTGEGVFGLQRAFLSAGVSTLMMSLWKIDDVATAEFMVEFYRSWLAGASKRDALRAARQRMRARHPDPEIWAAFVLVGE
ncbi:MAG: CHAT domain-containing tetratricopeptide repeat protein [Bacteroidota bacterium]|jgi:CHAT domain-containing protein/tetratricopeptide (TPR) repeat protein|nr:CHAT domain-containing tetratricopeptide repeat protein [Bacteroidota bacterium]